MRPKLCGAVIGAGLLFSGLPVLAHHSGAAEFDANKKINLKGVVTKVDWTNPHAHFFMDVKGSDGKVANWNLELASPSILIRNGWQKELDQRGRYRDGYRLAGQGQFEPRHRADHHVSGRAQVELPVGLRRCSQSIA